MVSFGYHSIPCATNNNKKPSVPVEFKLGTGGSIIIICLVDSGSDVIVLPKDIAELLNVKITGKSKSNGLNGEVQVKTGIINYKINKDHLNLNFDNVYVEVIDSNKIPVIFGRKGFFDKFKVVIKNKFSIKTLINP